MIDKEELRKERRTRIRWTIGIVAFDVLFVIIVAVFGSLLLLKLFPDIPQENLTGILTTVAVLVCVPTILLRETIIENWSKYYREQKKRLRQSLDEATAQAETENETLKTRLCLPEGARTWWDESSSQAGSSMKLRWAGCIVLEVLCILLTVGIVVYSMFLPPEACVTLMLVGCVLGIYGFCVLCEAYVKGIFYSVTPVACYALPLAALWFSGVRTEWILGVMTIVVGSVLFALFVWLVVVRPQRKKQRIIAEYQTQNEKGAQDRFEEANFISGFVSASGRRVFIYQSFAPFDEAAPFIVATTEDVTYKGLKIENGKPEVVRSIETQEEAERLALKFLEEK